MNEYNIVRIYSFLVYILYQAAIILVNKYLFEIHVEYISVK